MISLIESLSIKALRNDFEVIDLFQQIVYVINFAEARFLVVFCAIFRLFYQSCRLND